MAFLSRAIPAGIGMVIVAWSGSPGPFEEPHEPVPEYHLKAAFVYNFAKFVEWPARDTREAFRFCLIGKDPFHGVLDELVRGKFLNSRPLLVVRIATAAQARSCPVLYVGEGDRPPPVDLLHEIGEWPVLTISERAGFLDAGGIIQLLVDDKRVRFEINAEAARRSGLRVSSRLMRLARSVRP
jgi:hypothetical protein